MWSRSVPRRRVWRTLVGEGCRVGGIMGRMKCVRRGTLCVAEMCNEMLSRARCYRVGCGVLEKA